MLALRHGPAPRPVEAHEVSSFLRLLSRLPSASIPRRYAEEGASISIKRVQATGNSLVSLQVMWEHPRHPVPGRDRPIEPWSAETGAERGSSRPGLLKPVQLSGALEPVSARSGRQEFLWLTCRVLWAWMSRTPRWLLRCAPPGSGGPSRMMLVELSDSWHGCRPSTPP